MWKQTLLATITAGLCGIGIVGCDVDVEDEGKLPDVEVEPGKMPDVDVRGPDVDVDMEKKEVEVPDVDVDTEKKTIKVPDVDVDIPNENEE